MNRKLRYALLAIFCVAVLFAIPKAEISAAESNRIVVHHPGKEDGAGAIYRIWKVTGDDEGVAIDELNRTLLPLTEAQLDQRYGDGFDTEPADSSGTTAVNGLSNGRYYIRLRGEYDGKAIYFLLDLPVVKDGTVYRKVDVYPKASDVEDKPGSFELLKKGIDGTEEYPLPGVVFDLYRQDPDSGRWYVYRADLVTDENGKIILSGLPFGWYRLKEKKTPSGYVPAEDTDFNVQPGKRTYVVIDNEKAPPSGGHEFIKVDADDITKPLEGASFKVTYKVIEDGREVYRTVQRNGTDYIVTSGADGRFRVEDLPYGTYYLWETTVPKSKNKVYAPLELPIEFTIGEEQSLKAIRVITNKGEPPDTPPEPPETPSEPPPKPPDKPEPPPTPPKKPGIVIPKTGDEVQFLLMGAGIMLTVVGGVIYGRKGEDAERK